MTMTDEDRSALELARATATKMPGRAQQLAASLCQDEAIRLRPHELPPAEVSPDEIDSILDRGDCDHNSAVYGAALLLKRMLEAGVSRWHPDPVAALRDRAGNGHERLREALAQ